MIEPLSQIQWLALCLAALSIGMSKTGIQGIMLMIVPLMAMAFGAKESTGVILPMLCMADIIAVAYYKRIADWKIVARLLPTAVLGFFLAIGIDELSVSPSAVLPLRSAIRSIDTTVSSQKILDELLGD